MKHSIDVMLIEDNELDVRMIQLNARKTRLNKSFDVFNDGMSAMTSLLSRAANALPDVILLDLSLPGMSGHEVLSEIKSHPQLCHITVIVLTSSAADADVKRAYAAKAAAFVTKPIDASGFSEVLEAIDSFYFSVVTFPKAC